jgi:hypothetical protein
VSFEARIIAATNRDLGGLVESGAFREDLFFRLNVVEIELPPLRTRGRDVLALAQHFLEIAAGNTGRAVRKVSRDAAAKMLSYPVHLLVFGAGAAALSEWGDSSRAGPSRSPSASPGYWRWWSVSRA